MKDYKEMTIEELREYSNTLARKVLSKEAVARYTMLKESMSDSEELAAIEKDRAELTCVQRELFNMLRLD